MDRAAAHAPLCPREPMCAPRRQTRHESHHPSPRGARPRRGRDPPPRRLHGFRFARRWQPGSLRHPRRRWRRRADRPPERGIGPRPVHHLRGRHAAVRHDLQPAAAAHARRRREVILQGAQIDIFPGPALPAVQSRRLSEAGLQLILERIAATGFFAESATFTEESLAFDAPLTVFTLHADGREVIVKVGALGMYRDAGEMAPNMTERERQAHLTLAPAPRQPAPIDQLIPASAWEETDWHDYRAESLRLLVANVDGEPRGPSGSPAASSSGPPTGTRPPSATRTRSSEGARCGVVEGADAATWYEVLAQANQLTRYSSGRSHLPGHPPSGAPRRPGRMRRGSARRLTRHRSAALRNRVGSAADASVQCAPCRRQPRLTVRAFHETRAVERTANPPVRSPRRADARNGGSPPRADDDPQRHPAGAGTGTGLAACFRRSRPPRRPMRRLRPLHPRLQHGRRGLRPGRGLHPLLGHPLPAPRRSAA